MLWQPDAKGWLIRKDPDAGKNWRHEEKGTTEDEIVGWHHGFNGHEFKQAPGDGEGQGSLACCSPGSQRVGHDRVAEQQWQRLVCLKDSDLVPCLHLKSDILKWCYV